MNSARFLKKEKNFYQEEHTRRGKIKEFSRVINGETDIQTNVSLKHGVSVFLIEKYLHVPWKHFKQRIVGKEQTNANVA